MENYYKMLARAMIEHADAICSSIDRFILKADDDLADELKEEGYLDPKGTVAEINSMEEAVTDALEGQTAELVEALQDIAETDPEKIPNAVNQAVDKMLAEDTIAEDIEDIEEAMLTANVQDLTTLYIQESDGELAAETLRQRTSDWMRYWTHELGQLTRISTHQQITDLIQDSMSQGESIAKLTQKIIDGGWRTERYQAKRFALTEVLRAHSVAREEAIQQSPAVDNKEWRHTGAHKNKPRPNHVNMDRQIVPKTHPFELIGKDGVTYYPMYPRDSILPAGESVNCHCIHRGIVNKEILGLSYEERKALQEQAINADNEAYMKEKDEENKAAAGITPYNALDDFKQKTREKQVKYIGGKAKMALYDAGLITDEEMLMKVKKTSLQDLHKDGIFTVSQSAMRHSTIGDFTNVCNPKKPPGGKNGGNMSGGGHSQANIDELNNRGIVYNIDTTFSNGVRRGGVANHKENQKEFFLPGTPEAAMQQSPPEQTWFPETWDEDLIRAAGTHVANNPAVEAELINDKGVLTGYFKRQRFNGVDVCVIENQDHVVGTIFPDKDQREDGD